MEPTTTRTDPSEVETAAIDLRRRLHKIPEVAHEERQTAALVRDFLAGYGLEPMAEGLAGHGLLYRIEGGREGPDRLFRADLDALPLVEEGDTDARPGHHACGHDGHMAMLAGALAVLHARRSDLRGSIYGLFQPAEETGEGALHVLEDPAFPAVRFDQVFAVHNVPGIPLGEVVVRAGPMACASVGVHVHMQGTTTHAAAPHAGRNPIPALAELTLRATALPASRLPFGRAALVTPIHFDAGKVAYGTAAGEGSARFTVRAAYESDLDLLVEGIDQLAEALSDEGGFQLTVEEHERFPATENEPAAADAWRSAAQHVGLDVTQPRLPMPWSEDFGHFTGRFSGALACLGAGEDQPDLHTPRYDFPEPLVGAGLRLWVALGLEGAP